MRLPQRLVNTRTCTFSTWSRASSRGSPWKPQIATESVAARDPGVSRFQSRRRRPRGIGREDVLGDTRVEVLVLMIAAASIVLIACANLATCCSPGRGRDAVSTRCVSARCHSKPAGGGNCHRGVVPVCDRRRSGAGDSAADGHDAQRFVPVGLQPPTANFDPRLLPSQEDCRSRPASSSASDPHSSLPCIDCRSTPAACARCRWHGTTGPFRDGLVLLQVAATVVLLVAEGPMPRTLANFH